MQRVNLRRQLELYEVRFIQAALEATCGNKLQAAKLLTISRSCLYRRLDILGLTSGFAQCTMRTQSNDSQPNPSR